MFILPQNNVSEKEITSRKYDTAGIRSLTLDEQAAYRERMVEIWLNLCDDSRTVKAAAAIVGIPFATLNRWRKQPRPKSTRPHNVRKHDDQEAYDKLKAKVLRYRKRFESWGALKLHAYFKALGIEGSCAMIGRIISELISEKKIKSYYSGKFARKRSIGQVARKHAIARPKDLKSNKPGEVVQIDTMYMNVPGTTEFVFQINAICCFSKLSWSHTFDAVTAKNAKYLLNKVIRRAPFKVQAVQTDQGSEFRAEFEQVCHDKGITQYVNDPHSPTQNGTVERFNKTVRDDFCYKKDLPFTDLKSFNKKLDKFSKFFNTQRPYQGINNLTPMKFYEEHVKSQITL